MAERKAAPLKVVSESTREHETFKYYPALLSTTRLNLEPHPLKSTELSTSPDTVLTALAQLGACQTGTARSLVSLFDSEYQHIIAEATPTLPLVPNLRATDHEEVLWLCGTAIPRHFGVCEAALRLNDAQSADSDAEDLTTLPLTLVPNLQDDPRFASSPYCLPGSPAVFYAGVPIRTARGVNIGVYCVLDTVQRDGWDPALTRVLRNLSKSITEHLEAGRAAAGTRRSARMNRGLGSFVEGASTISGWRHDDSTTAFQDNPLLEGALNARQQGIQQREEDRLDLEEREKILLRGSSVTNPIDLPLPSSSPESSSPGSTPRRSIGSSSGSSHNGPILHRQPDLGGNSVATIFSKAANMIRESIEVEGCVFFDAQVRSFGGLNAASQSSEDGHLVSQSPSSSEAVSSSGEAVSPMCRVLGFSTTDASSVDGARPSALKTSLPEGFMTRLLRRYPHGKIFNFDAKGELRLTDSSEDDYLATSRGLSIHSSASSHAANSRRRNHPWARHREGSAILRAFPDARSVAFVPVRDSRKGRWTSGAFMYTNTPARIFTVAGELSYLTAFGMLAMAETFRLETMQAEKAKSDALSSLSHELRSPLHGVVLAAELMHDTGLTVFQGNILHTIETCGRTLMDTLDHLLDFSKINNFSSTAKSRAAGTPRSRNPWQVTRHASIEAGMKSIESNISIDSIVEDVVESVFAGYNFQYASVAQVSKFKDRTRFADVAANRRMDSQNAIQDFGPTHVAGGHINLAFNRVFISLYIDPDCNWAFHSQPGALRRILMNLFGNALKYTKEGTILVSARQESVSATLRRVASRRVVLTVADTGKGISEDYLANDLFLPFSQEDPLASGTGLGLSLVKQITTSLGGKVAVQSRLGVGTTVTVTLPMAPVVENGHQSISNDDSDFRDQVADLRGLRVLLKGFRDTEVEGHLSKPSRDGLGRELTEGICRDWLKMEVLADRDDLTPDVILVAEESMPSIDVASFRNPPCVVVCSNALVAFDKATSSESTQAAGVFEFISQPLGPRKLAKILLLACQRWLSLQTAPSATKEQVTPSLMSNLSLSDKLEDRTHEKKTSTATPGVVSPSIDASEVAEKESTPVPTASAATQCPPEMSSPSPSSQPLATGLQYLLVDDNSINLRILASYVKKLGRPMSTAMNGLQAYDTFRAAPERFSCIFMDISMPVMDGFEASRKIRAFEREKHLEPTTIIALSGLASASAQEEAYISGINLFLTKPVRLKDMAAVLESRNLL